MQIKIKMRKNSSKSITFKSYATIDLILFGAILAISEVCVFMAAQLFKGEAVYSLSFTVFISALIIVRWGWCGILYAVGGTLFHCLLANATPVQYLIWGVGTAFIAVGYLFMCIVKRRKVESNIFIACAYYAICWLAVNIGRAIVATCVGGNFFATLLAQSGLGDNGALALVIGLILVFVMRKFDGMWEGQKDYLLRLERERQDKMRRDTYGDEPIEIDEETIKIIRRNDDMFD